jgi:hypothetical protein
MFDHIQSYLYLQYRHAFLHGDLLRAFLIERRMNRIYEAMCNAGLATRLVIV